MTTNEKEAQRIRNEYARREREIGRAFYSTTKPANLFARQGQQRALLGALSRAGVLPLNDKRVLEVGVGLGRWLALFEEFGAARTSLAGIDLDDGRIRETRALYPGADLRAGDASALPWADGEIDVVFQSLVFTSVLDAGMRAAIAAEMSRVVSRTGVILWYDFAYNNPRNANVRGVRPRELRDLFPRSSIEIERVTLAPPLARMLVPLSWLAASVLERTKFLNTHYFAAIRPLR